MDEEIQMEDLDEYISTNDVANLQLAIAINRILFEQKMEKLMTALAHKLVESGVDFSKANVNKIC